MINIRLEGAPEVVARLERLSNSLPAAESSSLNRAMAAGRTFIRKGGATATGLAMKQVTAHMKLDLATPERLVSRLTVDDKKVPAILYLHFAGFKSGKGMGGQGYRFGTLPAGAFYADFSKRGWHEPRRLFERTTKKRFPLRDIKGPSIAEVVEKAGLADRTQAVVRDTFAKRLTHEAERLTNG